MVSDHSLKDGFVQFWERTHFIWFLIVFDLYFVFDLQTCVHCTRVWLYVYDLYLQACVWQHHSHNLKCSGGGDEVLFFSEIDILLFCLFWFLRNWNYSFFSPGYLAGAAHPPWSSSAKALGDSPPILHPLLRWILDSEIWEQNMRLPKIRQYIIQKIDFFRSLGELIIHKCWNEIKMI